MFEFYVACVRTHSVSKNCFYWKPLKIYTSRSSCIRFFKDYECKAFEIRDFGVIRLTQSLVNEVKFNEVFYGKD